MISTLAVLMATTLLFISDRGQFWDADTISSETEEIVEGKEISADFNAFQGQNVLLLVHGYNNDAESALSTYKTIRAHVDERGLSYDAIIGYLWPGYDHRSEYFEAKNNVDSLVSRMRSHIQDLSTSATRLDILAHSMGNLLTLKAFDFPLTNGKKLARYFYSLAPAVKDTSIEANQSFYQSVEQCEKMFVFHSDRDDVLKFGFSLAEWSEALGYEGLDKPEVEPKNVQFIDCTSFVDSHSAYFDAKPLYQFFESQQMDQTLKELNIELLADGTVIPIEHREAVH